MHLLLHMRDQTHKCAVFRCSLAVKCAKINNTGWGQSAELSETAHASCGNSHKFRGIQGFANAGTQRMCTREWTQDCGDWGA